MFKKTSLFLHDGFPNFQENVKSMFGALRNDKEFVDVTLVCEDAFQIDCHKAILALSSPFFNEILTKLKQVSQRN